METSPCDRRARVEAAPTTALNASGHHRPTRRSSTPDTAPAVIVSTDPTRLGQRGMAAPAAVAAAESAARPVRVIVSTVVMSGMAWALLVFDLS